MPDRRWLIGVVLAIPLLAGAAAYGLRARVGSELKAVVARTETEAGMSAGTASAYGAACSGTGAPAPACRNYDNLWYLGVAAIAAGVAGMGLLLVIRVAGTAAGRSRAVLLNAFRPGLYLTALGVVALSAVHGGLALATVYQLEGRLTGRVHMGVLFAMAVGVVAGVAAVAWRTFNVVRPAETAVIGFRIDRDAGRQLYQRVETLAAALGALRPQHVVVGLDPNFFVTEARVTCLNGELSGRTLYCSLPLARILSRAEFDAVIGHELGHFRGPDSRFSQRFYPVYRGTADSLRSLRGSGDDGRRRLPRTPAVGIVSHFLDAFALAERQHGRVRELAADLDGARVSSTAAMASALVKVHAFSGAWDSVCEAAIAATREGEALGNISAIFAGVVARDASRELVRGAGAARTTHPTDSHPPLNVRLEALGLPLKKVEEQALRVTPADAAISLIETPEAIETALSDAFQAMLARYVDVAPGGSAPDSC